MDKQQWAKLTPERKRDYRFERWLNPPDEKFSSPQAKAAYKARVSRLNDALRLREPDRVPVSLPIGNFPAYYAGGDLGQVMYDYDKLRSAWLKFLGDFDLDIYRSPSLVYSGRVLEMLDYRLYKWPGHGLPSHVGSYQFVEGEYMTADEYDQLIKDPSDFALRVYMPRVVGAFEPFSRLIPFSSVISTPLTFLNSARHRDVQAALEALLAAARETAAWHEAVDVCDREALAAGVPSLRGMLAIAPFDTVADSLRGTRGIMKDVYRQPDKLLEALDRIADLTIEHSIAAADAAGEIMVWFPLHKGDDTFMSQKQFETFYWPTLRKIVLALIDEGLMVTLFAEGHYLSRLETGRELPEGWLQWQFDKTDMAKAKEILGATACISGNVPTSLLCTGTPQEVRDYCRKLIDVCAPGGGFILSGGANATEAPAENLRAMTEAAKEYGVYKKPAAVA